MQLNLKWDNNIISAISMTGMCVYTYTSLSVLNIFIFLLGIIKQKSIYIYRNLAINSNFKIRF